jgi:hypothetical protein
MTGLGKVFQLIPQAIDLDHGFDEWRCFSSFFQYGWHCGEVGRGWRKKAADGVEKPGILAGRTCLLQEGRSLLNSESRAAPGRDRGGGRAPVLAVVAVDEDRAR